MLKRIEPTANGVLAFKAVGKITAEDYKSTLIPALEEHIKAHGKARFVYVVGPEFEGFEAGAVMDDALFGLTHWRDFERIAVVTDHDWIAAGVRMFMPLIPAETRLFTADKQTDALTWAAA